MADAQRARKLFDWVIAHIRGVAVMVVLLWVVMAIMCFGIIVSANESVQATRQNNSILQRIDTEAEERGLLLKQLDKDSEERANRSTQDRARLELLVRSLYDAQKCVAEVLLIVPEARTPKQVSNCFPPVPPPPPGFLPEAPK